MLELKRKHICIIASIVGSLIWPPMFQQAPAQNFIPAVESVSLASLITDGSKYSGRKVRVAGWLHSRFEDTALFFTQDDSEYGIYTNALWIDISPSEKSNAEVGFKKFDRQPVWLIGTFDSSFHGHMGLFPGAIHFDSISRIYRLGESKYQLDK